MGQQNRNKGLSSNGRGSRGHHAAGTIDTALTRELCGTSAINRSAAVDIPPSVRQTLATRKKRNTRQPSPQQILLGIISFGLGLGLPVVLGSEALTAYEFNEGWEWKTMQDSTIRHAYLQGGCNRRGSHAQKVSCVKSQLRQYAPSARAHG